MSTQSLVVGSVGRAVGAGDEDGEGVETASSLCPGGTGTAGAARISGTDLGSGVGSEQGGVGEARAAGLEDFT